MRQVRRLFTLVSRGRANRSSICVPHLTLEILYPPLPDLESLKLAIARTAESRPPHQVPAIGVVIGEPGGAISIELALTPELAELRGALAAALRQVGAKPHPEPVESWRPHLSVAGREEPGGEGRAVAHGDPAVVGYRFTVDSLCLSLPAETTGQFVEIGPYPLGKDDALSTRR